MPLLSGLDSDTEDGEVSMPEIQIDAQLKTKILAGRKAVDAYRAAHTALHREPWRKTIPQEHTPLLEKLVADLEKIGITSTELEFEPKKTEILAKLWADSDLLYIQELGFASREDIETEADREALELKWR